MRSFFFRLQKKHFFEATTWVLVALSLQILLTTSVHGTPLRIGTSDLLMPFVGIGVLWTWTKLGYPRPQWRSAFLLPLLVAITLWMSIALVVGRIYAGQWVAMGVVSKGGGWLVLLGYFAIGAWLGSFATETSRLAFYRGLVAVAWVISSLSLVFYELYLFSGDFAFRGRIYVRPEGLFDNPNAFSIFTATVVVFQLVMMNRRHFFGRRIDLLGLAILLLAIFFSRSRSAWFALPIAVSFLTVIGAIRIRHVVAGGVLALVLGWGILAIPGYLINAEREDASATAASTLERSPRGDSLVKLRSSNITGNLVDSGVLHRMEISKRAFALWADQPFFGIGLGSFYWKETQTPPHLGATIHTSVIWLLVETGLVGLLLFSGFFAVIFARLFRDWRESHEPLAAVGLGVVLTLGIASFGTEILYQRYLWILLGLAVVVPQQLQPVKQDWKTRIPSNRETN